MLNEFDYTVNIFRFPGPNTYSNCYQYIAELLNMNKCNFL